MRIVLDLQGAQTASRFRGIGRYSLALAQAIVRNRGRHEVFIALNGSLVSTIEPIRAAFDGLLPQSNIRVWQAPAPVRELDQANTWRRQTAEFLREAFLASLNPDVVHVSSLFEGYGDDAVTSIGRFTENFPTAVTLYDLIPLITPDAQLKANASYMDYYWRKIGHLKRAQLLLAISEFSRIEALEALQIPPGSAVNISSATAASFEPTVYSEAQQSGLLSEFGIRRPFVLYVGAADPRKNLERLINAVASMPGVLRSQHQLVIAGALGEHAHQDLQRMAEAAGLSDDELCLANGVSDPQLLALYNGCKLFILPSLHEGFGLPALEAMACGAAVIASNTSSLPEVVGRDDALFDPTDEGSIAAKMVQALSDDDFRNSLKRHGLEQARQFSWDISAQRAISALEGIHRQQTHKLNPGAFRPPRRPLLAYVSPLPPERTGIADYSAELLPELARYYEIEVITPQNAVTHPWVRANCPVRNVEWFRANASRYERVMYHVGNSPFHTHMFDLLSEIPGVVVLHDFFLSGVLYHDEAHGVRPNAWTHALLLSHGYGAVQERFRRNDAAAVVEKYPCNLGVLQHAQGVIVHSQASRNLAEQWYGQAFPEAWRRIPHLRTPVHETDPAIVKRVARRELGLPDNAFVVCSFGLLGPPKLNHRLLDAWLRSILGRDQSCYLVFVGENHGGAYGSELVAKIKACGLGRRVVITGWADEVVFRNYLLAADLAVQLRALSRGETSGTVIDCMNYALPTIVNANGSMGELPAYAVWMLPDDFTDAELADAMTTLYTDVERRTALGAKARESVRKNHSPPHCAKQYAEAIEDFDARARTGLAQVIRKVADLDHAPQDEASWQRLAQALAMNNPLPAAKPRQLLVDVTATARHDLKTGIERVARSICTQWLQQTFDDTRVEPVYLAQEADGRWHYRYARNFALALLDCPPGVLPEDAIEYRAGDALITVDISGETIIHAAEQGLYTTMKAAGVSIHCMIFDLLPIQRPEFFPPNSAEHFLRWAQAVVNHADGVVAISRTVANCVSEFSRQFAEQRVRPLRVSWCHLGADIDASRLTPGLDKAAQRLMAGLRARKSFLMVGTIEPRKGHLQALAAFEALWAEGFDVNLVIVGKEGWQSLPQSQRRTIPAIVQKLRQHPELNKRLFWLDGIADTHLEAVYTVCTCLIAASEDEGFGLPLIEAAQHNLPVIARDIPVFREVGGEWAFYFRGLHPLDMANAVRAWLQLDDSNLAPRAGRVHWLTWKQSADQLLNIILQNDREACLMLNTRLPPATRETSESQGPLRANSMRLTAKHPCPNSRTQKITFD